MSEYQQTDTNNPPDTMNSDTDCQPSEASVHNALHNPDWTSNAVWWHVYPLGFVGANIRPDSLLQRRCDRGLDALIPWLGRVKELGFTGLLLGPIFQSETHGYDTTDFKHIDDRLGGDASFDKLVEACRNQGLQIILDGVFNHVGRNHPAVAAALAGDSTSTWNGLVSLIPADHSSHHHEVSSAEDTTARLPVFEGHKSLVELDHHSPETVAYVAGIMNYWLDRGANGWRLDAAYSVDPEFWARTLPSVRKQHPDTWIFGEVIHGDYSKFVLDSTADSVTQYELWKSIWSSIAEGNFFELDWNLKRHNTFLDSFVPQTFIGNHDVTRIASRIAIPGAILALTVLMTVGGIPSIYYGDEYGMAGIKEERLGGDDAIRPSFPQQPEILDTKARRMFEAHRALIALRHQHPWLEHARTISEHLENRSFSYRSYNDTGDKWILTQLHLDPEPYATVEAADGSQLYDSRHRVG